MLRSVRRGWAVVLVAAGPALADSLKRISIDSAFVVDQAGQPAEKLFQARSTDRPKSLRRLSDEDDRRSRFIPAHSL